MTSLIDWDADDFGQGRVHESSTGSWLSSVHGSEQTEDA